MKRNISNKLLIIGCLLVMISCKAKKALVVTPTSAAGPLPGAPLPAATIKSVNPMDAAKASQFNYSTFSAKANAKLVIDGSSNDVVLTVHINHNKEIWISVAATILNLEVARAAITPDSIMVMDKVHGLYSKKPFSYVYQYANNQVNYKMLEALLVGNVIPEVLNDNNASFTADSGNTIVNGSLADLVYNLTLGGDMKVSQFNLSNHNQGQSLQVNYSAFIPTGGKTTPSQIDIQSATQNKKIQVNLHYTRIDLDQPLQYPFNIPENYKPEDGN